MPLGIIPALRAQAAAAGTDGIGYYVRAVLPDNQISNNLSYFDLRMQPGQSQTLEVEVVNESDKVITVDLAAVSASTNRNGIIDYKTPDIRDETLKIPFSEIAAPEDTSIVIEAHSTAMARITMTCPPKHTTAWFWAGLVFTQRPEDNALAEGVTLQNISTAMCWV